MPSGMSEECHLSVRFDHPLGGQNFEKVFLVIGVNGDIQSVTDRGDETIVTIQLPLIPRPLLPAASLLEKGRNAVESPSPRRFAYGEGLPLRFG